MCMSFSVPRGTVTDSLRGLSRNIAQHAVRLLTQWETVIPMNEECFPHTGKSGQFYHTLSLISCLSYNTLN